MFKINSSGISQQLLRNRFEIGQLPIGAGLNRFQKSGSNRQLPIGAELNRFQNRAAIGNY